MLAEDPRVPARVIFERLHREGYEGGITILKDYLAGVRPPRRDPRVYQRTSYLPGEIAQCDWWELPVSVPVGNGATRKICGLVTTLPHSAARAAVFCHSKTTADFCEAFAGDPPAAGWCSRGGGGGSGHLDRGVEVPAGSGA